LTFVTNLEPASLFGIESQAMLLAATDDEGNHVLATYPETVKPGASVG
jgi:methionyl-tRNA synthetase